MAPVLCVLFAIRWLRGKETRIGLSERFALGRETANADNVIWVHGASLGELTAARPLLDEILSRSSNLEIVVTMNSYTARNMVRGWGNDRIHARMAPLDYRVILRRFYARWTPKALVVLENELWPNRLSVCQSKAIPVLIAGGRISAQAISMWSRFPGLSKSITSAVSCLAPIDEIAAERFRKLGVAPSRIGPNLLLKATVELPCPEQAEYAELYRHFNHAKTILAASTHHGEDGLILRAFLAARQVHPDLRLILAPRHPERASEISEMLINQSLPFKRRSASEPMEKDTVVLLADTLGEMALWYSLARVTLVGGTWVDKGGHTPFEPAQFGSAIVHGPSTHNHARAFTALDSKGGAVLAIDEQEVARALIDICSSSRGST